MKNIEKRIQELFFAGYTVQRIVNEMHNELNLNLEKDQKYKKTDIRPMVEKALMKIKCDKKE